MYNFKRDTTLYIELDNVLYPIDIYNDFSFSQTYNEGAVAKKTLHSPLSLNRRATIVYINTANFSFTTPIRYSESGTLLSTSPDYISGNIEPITMYWASTSKVFRLNHAVIENIVFNIDKTAPFSMTVSGSASLLESIVALPAIPIAPRASDPYTIARCLEISIDGISINSIAAVSIEINNGIEWIPNSTIHNTLEDILNYKRGYVLTERRISGSITEFLADTASDALFNYSTDASIIINISSYIGESPPLMTFTLPVAVYTRRVETGDLLTRVYDFRLTDNTVIQIPTIRS